MGTKMKGIYKGFNKYISQIFVVKEREIEIEIGLPTDVKHVAHIGWDGPSGTSPSWMNGFQTGPEFASSSIGNSGAAISPWSSQDYEQSSTTAEALKDGASSSVKKKHKRRKNKSGSSPRSGGGGGGGGGSSSSSRSSRKPKSKLGEPNNPTPTNIEVA